jgi:hypothetical protein
MITRPESDLVSREGTALESCDVGGDGASPVSTDGSAQCGQTAKIAPIAR